MEVKGMTQGDGYREDSEDLVNDEHAQFEKWLLEGQKEMPRQLETVKDIYAEGLTVGMELGRKMPAQKPSRSKQDYSTPPEFIQAVKKRFGIIHFDADLAADARNKQAEFSYSKEDNALIQPWKLGNGWNWLNPPFAKIEPWVRKAYEETKKGAKTLVLVPAGVGSNWWAKWVHNKAGVLLLNGRLTFVGETKPYPKDCCLLVYHCLNFKHLTVPMSNDYKVWSWKK